MSNFLNKIPVSPITSFGNPSVPNGSTIGTNFSILQTGGFMEVYTLSGLTYTIPPATTGIIEFSGNSIPIQFTKGSGSAFSPDVLTLNSDNISSGRRKLGMLAYVYETNKIYQFRIDNYDTLWNNALASSGIGGNTVVISDFGTTVKNNSVAGVALISAWTASTISGIGGYDDTNASWRVLQTGGNSGGGTFTGGTVTGATIFTNGLTANTISAATYLNLPIIPQDYLPLSGGTVSGATIFTDGLTANTFSAGTYYNLPVSGVTGGTGISASSLNGLVTIVNTAPDQIVTLSGGAGIQTGGTYPNFVITNTAPDQTVTITGGTNIEIDGTYPNFGVSVTGVTELFDNYLPLSGGTVTGATIFTDGLTANTFGLSTTPNTNTTNTDVLTLNQSTGIIEQRSINSLINVVNLVTVGLTGSTGVDYYSVKEAVDSITGASDTNTYVVKVGPGVFYEDPITMKSYVDVIGESETNTIIQANDPNTSLIIGADQSMISDVQIQGCTGNSVSAVIYSSPTTPQLNAIFYVENVRFGTNYTHAKTVGTGGGNCIMQCSNVKYGGYPFTLGFYVTNDGSGVGRMQLRNVTSTNGGVTTTSGLIFAKADQPSCAFIVNGCLLTKSTGAAAGTGFWVENGGSLRLTAVNFQRWETAIYAPQIGSAPSIEAIALNFENCTTDVNIVHSGATGKIQGTDTYVKTLININAPLYEVNQDPRIITVAKKGGDFTSIKSAVDSITGSSINNRFLVSVGPGRFTEGLIDLTGKPYISVEGSNIITTEVVPISNTQHIFKIGQNNELSFLSLSGASSGYAGIYAYDIGDYGQAHKLSFTDCDTNIWVESNTQDTTFFGEYIDFNGDYSYGVKIIANNGYVALANMENYYNFPTGTGTTIANSIQGSGATLSVFVGDGIGNGNSGSTNYQIADYASLNTISTTSYNWGYSVRVLNNGGPSRFDIDSLSIVDSIVYDLSIEHPGTFGTFGGGSASHAKINNLSNDVYWAFLDIEDGEFDITRKISITFQDDTHTDASTLIFKGGTMGLMSGGTISVVSGLTVNVSSGFGYLQKTTPEEVYMRIDWVGSNITLPQNVNYYLYYNENEILSTSGSKPDSVNNILLGRVVTNSSTVSFIDGSPLNSDHTSNRFDSLFREALGPIYAFGSIVTEGTTPFTLDVTAGEYYYSTNEYQPTGGSGLTFNQYYRDGLGGWNISATTLVNNTQFDNNGTLSGLTSSAYTKHTLYIVGDGVNEKYFLVLGQNQYQTLVETENALLPEPPSYFTDSVTQIANIYIRQGFSGITGIEDIRPVIGFKAGGINASSLHANLLGLSSDDHKQYLLVDGSRAMSNNLNMGGNAITSASTYNGVTIESHASRHQNGGADEIATFTPSASAIPKADTFGKLDGWISDASSTVKGLTRLSVDPLSAATPIAVGINDTRFLKTITGVTNTSGSLIFSNNSGETTSFSGLTLGGLTATTISATTYQNLPATPFLPLSGGTVTGATNFTGGLTANTIVTEILKYSWTDIVVGNIFSYFNDTFYTNETGKTHYFGGGPLNVQNNLSVPNGSLQVGGNTLISSGLTANTISATTFTSSTETIIGRIPTSATGSVSTGSGPYGIYVQGVYVYVVNRNSSTLQIIDVSNPSSPVSGGTVSTGLSPNSVYVQGRYAYVVNDGPDTLQIFDVSNPSSPVSVGSVSTGLSPISVYVQGRYAYVVNGTVTLLEIFDVSNPLSPVSVGSVSISGIPNTVYVQGRYAYVGIGNLLNIIEIFDISNPSSPVLVGSVSTSGNPVKIYVQGKYVYVVNLGSTELQIFNVLNPSLPVLVGTVLTSVNPNSVYVQGRYSYVVGSNTLQIFDVSNPSSPVSVGTVSTGSSPRGVYVQGRYAYVINYTSNTLQIFDVGGSYIQQLEAGGILTSTLESVGNATIGNDLSVVGGLNVSQSSNILGNLSATNMRVVSGLTSTTISATTYQNLPTDIRVTGATYSNNTFTYRNNTGGTFSVLFNTVTGLTVNGNLTVTGTTTSTTISATTYQNLPTDIRVTGGTYSGSTIIFTNNTGGTFNVTGITTSSSFTGGTVTGATSFTNGLTANTISATTFTSSTETIIGRIPTSATSSGTTDTNPYSVYVQGRYVYVVNFGSNTLQIFDVSNPSSPVLVGTVSTGTNPWSLYVQGRYAYVVNTTSFTLQIIDVSNPSSPVSVGTVSTGSNPRGVYVQGRYAYVTNNSSNTLQIFDVSNPSSPVSVGTVSTGSSPRGVYVQGRYAYVINGTSNTFQIFDVSNPSSPVSVGTVSTGNLPIGLYVQGRYAYVVNTNSATLQIFDVSNPSSPVSVVTVSTLSGTYSVYVQGRYAYVTSLSNSLQIIDVSNLSSPVSVGTVSTGLFPRSVYVQGRYVYVVNQNSNALQIFDVGGSYIQQLEAGGILTNTLESVGNATIGNDLAVVGGLNVSQSANILGNLSATNMGVVSGLTANTITPTTIIYNDLDYLLLSSFRSTYNY